VHGDEVHLEAAGEADDGRGEHEREQALPVHRDAGRGRGGRVFARRAQHPPEPRALVGERDADRDERPQGSLPDARRLRHRRERVQPRADLLVVAQHVVHDLEHRERRDPGSEAGETHQREAHHDRERGTCRRGECEGRHVAHGRVAEEAGEVRHDRGLLARRHREHARRPCSDGEEADVPEREDARVADEDVETDDDRDVDERVDEVRLVRAGDGAEERSGEDERKRHRELHAERGGASHTRSTAPRARVKRPSGRASSTTITAAKRNVGRYWLCAVGSAPPRIPLAKPIEKPPSVAGTGRLRPPRTTPASTTIVSLSANVGVASGVRTVMITATTAASAPESSTAPPITRFARTPRSRAVRKSIDAARMCRPTAVRSSRSFNSARQPAATRIETIEILRMRTPPRSHGWLSGASDVAIVPSDPKARSAMLCNRYATANVATSITAGDWRRSGRKTSQSMSTESASTTPKQKRIETPTGSPHDDPYASAYAPAITSWPYAKLTSRSTPKTRPIPTAISA